MIPNTDIAEIAAIERTILLCFSFFFSWLSRCTNLVTLTLFSTIFSSGEQYSLNFNSELINVLNTGQRYFDILLEYKMGHKPEMKLKMNLFLIFNNINLIKLFLGRCN